MNVLTIFSCVLVIFGALALVYLWIRFVPTEKKKENLKMWLRYAVYIAEKEYGSGTGQLKLQKAYDMAVEKFPWVATLMSMSSFDEYIQEALTWLNKQMNTNPRFKELMGK